MGEYRDGRWVPTFGDDQFGVVDHPGQRHEDHETIQRQAQRIAELKTKLKQYTDLYCGTIDDDCLLDGDATCMVCQVVAEKQAMEAKLAEVKGLFRQESEALAAAQADRLSLAEELSYVLEQACDYSGSATEAGWYDTGALTAYLDGWEKLVSFGFAERDGEPVGRRGFYRPKWEAIAAAREGSE